MESNRSYSIRIDKFNLFQFDTELLWAVESID